MIFGFQRFGVLLCLSHLSIFHSWAAEVSFDIPAGLNLSASCEELYRDVIPQLIGSHLPVNVFLGNHQDLLASGRLTFLRRSGFSGGASEYLQALYHFINRPNQWSTSPHQEQFRVMPHVMPRLIGLLEDQSRLIYAVINGTYFRFRGGAYAKHLGAPTPHGFIIEDTSSGSTIISGSRVPESGIERSDISRAPFPSLILIQSSNLKVPKLLNKRLLSRDAKLHNFDIDNNLRLSEEVLGSILHESIHFVDFWYLFKYWVAANLKRHERGDSPDELFTQYAVLPTQENGLVTLKFGFFTLITELRAYTIMHELKYLTYDFLFKPIDFDPIIEKRRFAQSMLDQYSSDTDVKHVIDTLTVDGITLTAETYWDFTVSITQKMEATIASEFPHLALD